MRCGLVLPLLWLAACASATPVPHPKASGADATGDGLSVDAAAVDGAAADAATSADAIAPSIDLPPADSGPFVPAPHRLPPELDYGGGGVLAATRVVSVFFAGEKSVAQLTNFGEQLTHSPWWQAVTGGWCTPEGTCVGEGGPSAVVQLPFAASPSYEEALDPAGGDLYNLMASVLDLPEAPTPDANNLYVIYMPKSAKVHFAPPQQGVGCKQFGGYHSAIQWQGKQIPYAVVLDCGGMGTSAFDQRTLAASHEIIEAATDPFPDSGFALSSWKAANQAWLMTLGGGETADLCIDPSGAGRDRVKMGNFVVQRSWSASAAKAGHDPCQPVPESDQWLNVAPVAAKDDNIKLKVGQPYTFDLVAYSDEPVADGWHLQALDLGAMMMGKDSPLTVSFDDQSEIDVQNGDHVPVTLLLEQSAAWLKSQGSVLLFVSRQAPESPPHFWPVRVHQSSSP